MEKLMKPAEYAKELGISRQAVYAKIKRGILKTKDVEGKLYIAVDNSKEIHPLKEQSVDDTLSNLEQEKQKTPSAQRPPISSGEYQRLLAAKDETIEVLKGTVEDLKESNKQMSGVLRGEIDLLKSAFSEMRSLYMHRIEQMKTIPHNRNETIVQATVNRTDVTEPLNEWISVKKFFKRYGIEKEKMRIKIMQRFTKACQEGDKRFSEIGGKIKVNATETFSDILESVVK